MANKEEADKLYFNVELYSQALNHLQFLKAIENVPELKQVDILKRAVYRYEKFWLPLAADHNDKCLVAPQDIEWVWHCHMLNPAAYERDCQTTVGITVNHTLYKHASFTEKQNESRKYWLQKYGTQAEPFAVDYTCTNDQHKVAQYTSQFTYDIIEAAGRQAIFYYQVSLPHFKDNKFLKDSILRYKQFLFMKTRVQQDFVVPCYDIDLIWHTHKLNPLVYKEDMVRIIGYLFNHDDSVNDRSENSKLNKAGKETSENWQTFYGENFSIPGAMYRGKPPQGHLPVVDDLLNFNFDKAYSSVNKTSIISLDSLTLTMSSKDSRTYKSFRLIGLICKEFFVVETWLTLPCRFSSSSNTYNSLEMKKVGHYKLDTKTADSIRFELYGLTGLACCKSEAFLGSSTLNLLPVLNQREFTRSDGPIKDRINLGDNISLDIEGRFSKPKFEHENEMITFLRQYVKICLEIGQYKTVTIPGDVQQLFGPVAIESRPESASNICQTATHRFKSILSGETLPFEVTIIHSQPLLLSVIQIMCNNKMVVVAHLINSDQLPLPTQVSGSNVKLNPKEGERAIIIKNNEGDWGIVIGRWRGFKRGIKGSLSECSILGDPGKLTARFYKFSNDKVTNIYRSNNSHNLFIEEFEFDITSNIIQIDTTKKDIAENIALIFSVSLLHVLCVPRPEGYIDGQKVEPTGDLLRGDKVVSVVKSDTMPFMVATGLHSNTPSNCYIHRTFDNMTCSIGGGKVIKCESDDWDKLDGKNDPNSTGCGCGGSTAMNHKQFSAGLVGAGCGGCGGRKYMPECGSCGGHGKYAMMANTSKSSKVAYSSTGHTGTDTKSGTGDSSSFAVDHLHISVLDYSSSCGGGGGGDSGGGCDSGFD